MELPSNCESCARVIDAWKRKHCGHILYECHECPSCGYETTIRLHIQGSSDPISGIEQKIKKEETLKKDEHQEQHVEVTPTWV